MSKESKVKVTYSLPARLVGEVRNVVREGAAPSYSAFVERALRDAVREARDRLLAAELEQAARDPLFIEDLDAVERDFETANAESSSLIP